jgi:hypothetical protein
VIYLCNRNLDETSQGKNRVAPDRDRQMPQDSHAETANQGREIGEGDSGHKFFFGMHSHPLSTRHGKSICLPTWSQVLSSQVVHGTPIMSSTPSLSNSSVMPACDSYRKRWVNRLMLRFHFIQLNPQSFPKRRSEQTSTQLFSIANAPQYPTAQTIQQFLKQSRITETELSVDHIEMLLNVLVLDGDVEKVCLHTRQKFDLTKKSVDARIWTLNVGFCGDRRWCGLRRREIY